MHLNKLLEQIKRHQSPTEAIDKLATALEKHEGSLLEKGFTILKSELAANMYEAINGPHFVVGGGSSSSCSSGCGADGVEMASVVETKQKQIRISLV